MPNTKGTASCRESLSGQAYLAIRDRILHGQLSIGAVLSRRKLATDLGMSMLPICAAVQRLENEGLVESKPRVGTRVRIPTEKDIREQYVIREALECQAARLVAEKATLLQRQDLVRMADQLDALYRRAGTDRDPEFLFALHGYHMQIHMRIAEYSGVSALRELIEKNNILVWNWLYDLIAPQSGHPQRFHRDLASVITKTDVDAAEQAMRLHIQFGREHTIRTVVSVNSSPATRWRLREAPAAQNAPVTLTGAPLS
jgi:DNA-binding GntR family transcriptional regulator